MANSKSKHRRVQMKIRQHWRKRIKKQKEAAKAAAATEGKKK
ncbi:aminopeptidase [Corallococcus sp. ZKHCc1 1396]|uniref:Aminopeptidase n=1 Tax=Corallococcus soli TaxID=2710757 RepID=A0ABR9PN03_9BACT|nr:MULTISPECIES: aminopeptidase [Corallococcus]MBE4749257.1 aminopeptidase [Corallococcus soli]MCY1033744.1 aminopeptidase [Corallococcus sp. BB11-1]